MVSAQLMSSFNYQGDTWIGDPIVIVTLGIVVVWANHCFIQFLASTKVLQKVQYNYFYVGFTIGVDQAAWSWMSYFVSMEFKSPCKKSNI